MATKFVTLISSDNELFEVSEAVALKSQALKNMIDDVDCDGKLFLPRISSEILTKVIEYCKFHVDNRNPSKGEPATPQDKMRAWNLEFVKVDQETLFHLIMAANYLNIKDLLDITCERLANMISGMPIEEIRELFGIENDFTKEEEEAIRKENAWAFE